MLTHCYHGSTDCLPQEANTGTRVPNNPHQQPTISYTLLKFPQTLSLKPAKLLQHTSHNWARKLQNLSELQNWQQTLFTKYFHIKINCDTSLRTAAKWMDLICPDNKNPPVPQDLSYKGWEFWVKYGSVHFSESTWKFEEWTSCKSNIKLLSHLSYTARPRPQCCCEHWSRNAQVQADYWWS